MTFRHPTSLLAALTGTADEDPWAPDALVWPLLEVIDAGLDAPWCATLAAHLGHFDGGEERELRLGRRYAVARRLAGLFASYARQRPQLLIDWLAGDTGDLGADLQWQPHLWRELVDRVAADPPHVRHARAVARLRTAPGDLPARVSLFGHTRLPRTDLELLEALSVHHDLHLWLPHPSGALWDRLTEVSGVVPRREDTSHRAAAHPLLVTLGRDTRELQRILPAGFATDEHRPGGTRPDTLLGWLQSDIAANAVRPQGRSLAAGDRSVQVHSCHGAARQVDVLREVLLGLLADDPSLQPRDILVMCPDIETYAPLIVAGFGLGEVVGDPHPAHHLRVRLADRALVQTNPLLGLAGQLLALAAGRATASEVLNVAEAAPVRARFGFTDDDLDTVAAWVREANIRWGFDSTHREPFGVGEFIHNTWRFGIDRILAGVAMSDDSQAWLDTTLPLDDVSSNRVELAGRLAEFVARLQVTVQALSGAKPLRQWLTGVADGIAALTAARDLYPDIPVVFQVATTRRGQTVAGDDLETLIRAADELGAHCLGLNCFLDPAEMYDQILELAQWTRKPLSAQPNVGKRGQLCQGVFEAERSLHTTVRTFSIKLVEAGVRLIGGCCGITPEHIRLTREHLKKVGPERLAELNRFRAEAFETARRVVVGDRERERRMPPTALERDLNSGDRARRLVRRRL